MPPDPQPSASSQPAPAAVAPGPAPATASDWPATDWQGAFDEMRADIDRLFAAMDASDPFAMLWPMRRPLAAWPQRMMPAPEVPVCELRETETGFELSAEVPGYRPEDLDLRMADGALLLRGERGEERAGENGGRRWSERSRGSFRRVIRLPATADASAASAEVRDGVLRVAIPRRAENGARETRIEVRAG